MNIVNLLTVTTCVQEEDNLQKTTILNLKPRGLSSVLCKKAKKEKSSLVKVRIKVQILISKQRPKFLVDLLCHAKQESGYCHTIHIKKAILLAFRGRYFPHGEIIQRYVSNLVIQNIYRKMVCQSRSFASKKAQEKSKSTCPYCFQSVFIGISCTPAIALFSRKL